MLSEHKQNNAALTVACVSVPKEEASAFGVMDTDEEKRITSFVEKPCSPPTMQCDPSKSLVSMGIYIFNMEVLQKALRDDSEIEISSHDFGKDLIPKLIPSGQVYAYQFCSSEDRVDKDCYWRDVGTLDSFYEANMDLLEPLPPMSLYQRDWSIRTYEPQLPPARTVSSGTGREGVFITSIIGSGVINSGGSVQHSVISPSVRINDGAKITDSILFDNVEVGEGCQIVKCIIDKHVKIPPYTQIGLNHEEDTKKFKISEKGIVVIPESYRFE